MTESQYPRLRYSLEIYKSRAALSLEIINELKDYSIRQENIEVKLKEQEIAYENKTFKFELDSFKKKCLLEGLDDIALSLKKVKNIENFENKISQDKPWL